MIPASITDFAALSSFKKVIFSQETKDGDESTSVGDFDQSRKAKWAKVQNLVDRIHAQEGGDVLKDQDLRHIFTHALMEFLGDLSKRMENRGKDVLDFKKGLKSDLDSAFEMLEDNLNGLLASKVEAHKLAYQERKDAADRAHQLQLAAIEHRGCCIIS